MLLRQWEDLPTYMKNEKVRIYYDLLAERKFSLCLKRIFDVVVSSILIVLLAIPMLIIAWLIKLDSKGPAFYRQERITTYGRVFKIHKFRTMVVNADKIGSHVTKNNDSRITHIGYTLRKYRLDELPQLFDVFVGNMSFVGTRPEACKYIKYYSDEMMATLLLPAGVTSEASICYKDEASLLEGVYDVDQIYVESVLPEKMIYNLNAIKNFSFVGDIKIMIKTLIAVFIKD